MKHENHPRPDTLPLQLTRDEVHALLVALLNVSADLGEHERPICNKVREAWDALRERAPEQREFACY